MEGKEFDSLVNSTIEEIKRLMLTKGEEYAGSADRLANFKRGAALTGCTPLQCLFIYMSKHYDAVATFIRKDAEGKEQILSEPIEGRLDDLINYCILAKGLLADRLPEPLCLPPERVTHYTYTEGGEWIMCLIETPLCPGQVFELNPVGRVLRLPNVGWVHSFKTSCGREFDAVNGWRSKSLQYMGSERGQMAGTQTAGSPQNLVR